MAAGLISSLKVQQKPISECLCFQLKKLQVVICEKDVRFQEQIQKHEEELLRATAKSQNDNELQQVHYYACMKTSSFNKDCLKVGPNSFILEITFTKNIKFPFFNQNLIAGK